MVIYRRERHRRATLVLVILTSLALATLDQRGSGLIDTARRAVRDVVGPVQDLSDAAVAPAVDFFDDIGRAGELEDENRALRRQVTRSRGALADAEVDRARVEELERLLDVPGIADDDAVSARVTSMSVGNFERTFRIDRGTDAGIEIDMPVVVGRGLVGQVIAVSRTNATVRRIDDRRFAVGVRLVEEAGPGPLGVVEGQADSRLLRLSLDDPRTKVSRDQVVVASGLDFEPFPPNLPVAIVERGATAGAARTRDALLRPLVDLDEIDIVKVIRWRAQEGPP